MRNKIIKWLSDNNLMKNEIYLDYQDCISDEQINKILNSEYPWEKFYEYMDKCYMESIWDLEDEIIRRCTKEFDFDEEDIRDIVLETIVVSVDYDHFLKKEYCVNVIIDHNGNESNYEFTLNNTYPHYNYSAYTDEILPSGSGLHWLLKQNGITLKEARKAFKAADCSTDIENPLVKDIYVEVLNASSHLNSLVFFATATLEDLLNWNEKPVPITIQTNTRCGLVDFWNGAGSCLEIKIPKDLKILPKHIYQKKLMVDDQSWCGCVREIYGMFDDFYNKEIKFLHK